MNNRIKQKSEKIKVRLSGWLLSYRRLYLALLIFSLSISTFAGNSELQRILSLALENNPELKVSEAAYRASDAMVSPAYTPDDPMIGISKLERGMETTYFTVTQKFRFPSKYYIQGKSNKELSLSKKAIHDLNVLSTRKEVIESYYDLYRVQQSINFTLDNLRSVKEVARVAEKKYSAKQGVRADSMRSHVEITRLEIDLLNYRQEEQSIIEKLKALVNYSDLSTDSLTAIKAPRPKLFGDKVAELKKAIEAGSFLESSQIKAKKHELKSAEWDSSLAKWEFAPDIQLQYQQAISGQPEDSRIYGIGITVPLFFWSKGYKAKAASRQKTSKYYSLVSAQRKTKSKIIDLLGRVETLEKTLRIYDTSLIPQAEGTYNTSLSSYRANNIRLIDLLDSERSLYQVRLGFYKTLQMFAKNISELEKVSGVIVSDL